MRKRRPGVYATVPQKPRQTPTLTSPFPRTAYPCTAPPPIFQPGCRFSPSGTYATPPEEVVSVREHLELLRAYPIVPAPEIFGLHDNADITCDQNETYDMFSTVLSLQPRVASGKRWLVVMFSSGVAWVLCC